MCLIPNVLLQKSKPPTPPSDSASMERQPFKIAIPKMLKNKNYILLLVAFGCYFGIFNALSIILSFLIKPFFTSNLPLAVAAVGGSPVVSGIIGVMVIGPMQRKQGVYKKWIVICMCGNSAPILGSLLAVALFYPLLMTEVLAVASLISAFNSFFLIPLVPIML